MGKKEEVKETPQQRAMVEIGMQQSRDFKQRWLPVQKAFAKHIAESGDPKSFERRRATTMAGVDTSARFGVAKERLDATAAAAGGFGGSAHKLAITGLAGDEATSGGLSAVAADQATDQNFVAGLGAVTALGQGQKATAINGLGESAAISGRQAAADAEEALQSRIGNAALASKAIGTGAGLWSGATPAPMDAGAGSVPGGYIDPNGRQFNNPSAFTPG